MKLEKDRKQRPILLFENVKGTKLPVLTNVHASRGRLAQAINCAPEVMLQTYLRAMERPLAPRVVATGPVKEVVERGSGVDLYALPQIVHHEGEGPLLELCRALESGASLAGVGSLHWFERGEATVVAVRNEESGR